MNASHVAGGGLGALLGALIVGILKHFGWATITDVDAAVIGSAALSAGIGIGHAIAEHGITGIAKTLWRGHSPSSKATPPVAAAPVEPPA